MRALALLFALAPAQEPDEAAALYRKMEEKLLAAKTIRLSATLKSEGEIRHESTGVLVLDKERHRVRHERTRVSGELPPTTRVFCDGRTLRSYGFIGPSQDIIKPSLAFGRNYALALPRISFMTTLEWDGWNLEDGAWWKRVRLEGFKTLKKETLDGKPSVAISFTRVVNIDGPGSGGEVKRSVTLWIDAETFLPLKRVEAKSGKCLEWIETERYDVKLDAPVADADFKLPE